MVVLLGCGVAEGAELEDVPVVDPGRGPAECAVDADEQAAGGQVVTDELAVGEREPSPFDPEVRHPGDHETVLVGIVHVMQDEVRVGGEQCPAGRAYGRQVAAWIVRGDAPAAEGSSSVCGSQAASRAATRWTRAPLADPTKITG